jgi:hypothetical protein
MMALANAAGAVLLLLALAVVLWVLQLEMLGVRCLQFCVHLVLPACRYTQVAWSLCAGG